MADRGMTVRGGCLCEAVEFEVDLPFIKFVKCHCSRCRGASGSALAMTALSSPAAFADIDTSHTGSIDIHSHWMPEVYANALNQLRPGIASI